VKRFVDGSYCKAKEILTAKKNELGELARLLLEKEVVEEADLKKILQPSEATA
jgi:ATP-dependent Zn protease